MPSLVVPDVVCVAGRTEEFEWEAYKADGRTPEGFASDDVVRFKLAGSSGGDPFLDLSTAGATTNGSRVVVDVLGESSVTAAKGRVRIAQGDSVGLSGRKYFELNLVDNSESNPDDAIKPICRGYMILWPAQGGNLGVTP